MTDRQSVYGSSQEWQTRMYGYPLPVVWIAAATDGRDECLREWQSRPQRPPVDGMDGSVNIGMVCDY